MQTTRMLHQEQNVHGRRSATIEFSLACHLPSPFGRRVGDEGLGRGSNI
jgi:hypothetical protein